MAFEPTSQSALYVYPTGDSLKIGPVKTSHPTASVNLNGLSTTFASDPLIKKYPEFFSEILENPSTLTEIQKKINNVRGSRIKNANFTIKLVHSSEAKLVGVAVFLNDKLLDLDKLPAAAIIDGETINGRSVDEFTILNNMHQLDQRVLNGFLL